MQAEGGEQKAPVGQSFVFWGGLAGMIFVPVFSGVTQCPAWSLGRSWQILADGLKTKTYVASEISFQVKPSKTFMAEILPVLGGGSFGCGSLPHSQLSSVKNLQERKFCGDETKLGPRK